MMKTVTFDFYFGRSLGEQFLRQTDNLGGALQDSSTSATQGNSLTQDVVKTLLKDRTDSSFSIFWARILQGKTTEIQGAFLLFGKTGCSGDKSNGTYFSTGNFSKKKEYLLRYYSFLVFTGMIEKSCSICGVSIVSSSLMN